MKTHVNGSGSFGLSYEVQENGHWVKYKCWFTNPVDRDISFIKEKRRAHIRNLKIIGNNK